MAGEGSFLMGDLAKQVGVNRETLRYYERRGLLKPSRRTRSGYRLYDAAAAARLRFIKHAQSFGFTLDEIAVLVGLRPDSPRSCQKVLPMLDQKVADLRARIEEMRRFHQQLLRYRDRCRKALDDGSPCPVIVEVTTESKETTS